MSIYKCNAVIEENKECGRSCWGKTIYCMWHNCWLTWYCLYLYIFPHNRSIGWVYYDRDFLKDMRPSPIISTMSAITGIGFLCLFTVVFYLIGINKYYRSQSFLEIFTKSIWIVAFVCILTMALGNKKIIFPKLLLGFSIVLIILQLIRINLTNNWGFENISILCGRFAYTHSKRSAY